jgi:DHA1 family inner membrane transport protein
MSPATDEVVTSAKPVPLVRLSSGMKPFAERSLLLLLAAIQFTHITDFMIMMPLGPQLMRDLSITPAQFGSLVSAYTISAGLVGLAAAPFMDRFDRRVLLLWTYAGFTVGTLACALSHSFTALFISRAVSGAFGGVSGALVLATASDIVPPIRRATGIAIVMTAFSVAAALGVPFGLFLAQSYEWEAPFFFLVAIAAVIWLLVFTKMPPVRGHLEHTGATVVREFIDLLRNPNVGRALVFMAMMVFGHFSIIPLLSPYLVSNVGIREQDLLSVYFVGGVLTVFTGPRVGRLADKHGRHFVFTCLVLVACVVTLALTNIGRVPLWLVLTLAGLFFVFASGRFGPGLAIMSLAVHPRQRGAFMSLTACTRDLTSGITTAAGGFIVTRAPSGELMHYNWLGWIAVAASLLSLWLARRVQPSETTPVPALA